MGFFLWEFLTDGFRYWVGAGRLSWCLFVAENINIRIFQSFLYFYMRGSDLWYWSGGGHWHRNKCIIERFFLKIFFRYLCFGVSVFKVGQMFLMLISDLWLYFCLKKDKLYTIINGLSITYNSKMARCLN